MKRRLTLALLLMLVTAPMAAQTVWRCGPDGRSFQAVPCADGQPMALRARPGAGAVAEARAVAVRERNALKSLAAERRAREQEARANGFGPAGIAPQAGKPQPPPRRARAAAEDFSASAPRARPAD